LNLVQIVEVDIKIVFAFVEAARPFYCTRHRSRLCRSHACRGS